MLVNQNVLDTLILSEITLRRITVMLDDERVSSRWVIDKPKEGGYNTSSPVSLSNMFYTKPGKKVTFFGTIFVVFALSNELDGEYIEANCFSNIKLYICGS